MSMLTQCPACETVYRITSRHLEAAAGYVTCGECDHVFDARERLAEEPRKRGGETLDLTAVPAVLRDDVVHLHQTRTVLDRLWPTVAVIAVMGLLAQSGWYTREWWYPRAPAMATVARDVCVRMGCLSGLPRRSGDFSLLAREIRVHPHHNGALLLNALFVNRADDVADYPIVQLRLEDSAGTVLGVRRFTPAEYLEEGVDIPTGIDAGKQVGLSLELVEPAGGAQNFEITFH